MTDTPGPARAATPRRLKPAEQATEESRRLLGELLAARRGELGYAHRTTFGEERGLHWRMITDIEQAYRDTFTIGTLAKVAQAYGVTRESVLAVLEGSAGKLEPLPDARPRPARAGSSDVPVPEELRAAGQDRADEIQDLLTAAAIRTGNPDPPGDEVFGPGSWEAQSWDMFRRQFPSTQRRLWIIAGASVPDDRAPGQRGTAAGLTAEAALERGNSAGGAA